jgi:hypothetical protein
MSLFISDRKANSQLLDTLNSSKSYTTTRTLEETPSVSEKILPDQHESLQESEDSNDYGGNYFPYLQTCLKWDKKINIFQLIFPQVCHHLAKTFRISSNNFVITINQLKMTRLFGMMGCRAIDELLMK